MGYTYLPVKFHQGQLQGFLFRRDEWRRAKRKNLFPSPLPDKASVPAAPCLRKAPSGAGLWLQPHQLHRMPTCSLAGYVNVAMPCKPDVVHRTVTFKAHGNGVICLFNQDINRFQITEGERRNGEVIPGRDDTGA